MWPFSKKSGVDNSGARRRGKGGALLDWEDKKKRDGTWVSRSDYAKDKQRERDAKKKN